MKTDQVITPTWPAAPNVHAYTCLKPSNVRPANQEVDQQKLNALLNLPNDPIWIKQTHSNIAVPANHQHKHKEADASYATTPNQVCAVLTADCLPILVTNKKGTAVAAIHAGWKGLGNSIIENTLEKFNDPAEELLVWLGPAIGPSKFLVRADVRNYFIEQDALAEQAFEIANETQWLANLYQLATFRLQKSGITNIFGGNFCTYTDQDRFYSYRRDGNPTGRMVSLIWFDA